LNFVLLEGLHTAECTEEAQQHHHADRIDREEANRVGTQATTRFIVFLSFEAGVEEPTG